jgi:hypothetical protein
MRPSPLPTIVLASSLALAQSNTTCPNQNYIDKSTFSHVNATGTTPFTWNTTSGSSKPWHMSVLVNQTGKMSENGNGGTISWPYLSVPDGVRGNACVYAFGPVNQTATDGSCGGVFSNECSEYLLDKVRENSRRASGGDGECELWLETSEELVRVREMCGFTNDRALVCKFLFPFPFPLSAPNSKGRMGKPRFSDNGTQPTQTSATKPAPSPPSQASISHPTTSRR